VATRISQYAHAWSLDWGGTVLSNGRVPMSTSWIAALLMAAAQAPAPGAGSTSLPESVAADESTNTPATAPDRAPQSVRPADDAETPKAQARAYGENRHVDAAETPKARAQSYPDRRPPANQELLPTFGLGLEAGYAYGGDELVRATFSNGESRSIHAGDGLFILVAAHWTPVWIRDAVGLGFSVSGGIKVDEVSASNGSVDFTRFPLAASLQLLAPMADRWFMLVRAGVVKELGGNLSGNGVASGFSVDFSSKLGVFGDWGLYRAIGKRGGLVLMVRGTKIDYAVGGLTIAASNVAVAGGWHFAF